MLCVDCGEEYESREMVPGDDTPVATPVCKNCMIRRLKKRVVDLTPTRDTYYLVITDGDNEPRYVMGPYNDDTDLLKARDSVKIPLSNISMYGGITIVPHKDTWEN